MQDEYANLNELEKLKKFLIRTDFYSKLILEGKSLGYIYYNYCRFLYGHGYQHIDKINEDDYYALSYAYYKLKNQFLNIGTDTLDKYIDKMYKK